MMSLLVGWRFQNPKDWEFEQIQKQLFSHHFSDILFEQRRVSGWRARGSILSHIDRS